MEKKAPPQPQPQPAPTPPVPRASYEERVGRPSYAPEQPPKPPKK